MPLDSPVTETASFTNIAATTTVLTGAGKLLGIFVASATATPTIAVYDSVAGTSPIIANTFTPSPGAFYPIPGRVDNGIRVVISGTVDCTVFWDRR